MAATTPLTSCPDTVFELDLGRTVAFWCDTTVGFVTVVTFHSSSDLELLTAFQFLPCPVLR